jgi:hypothetical protein
VELVLLFQQQHACRGFISVTQNEIKFYMFVGKRGMPYFLGNVKQIQALWLISHTWKPVILLI